MGVRRPEANARNSLLAGFRASGKTARTLECLARAGGIELRMAESKSAAAKLATSGSRANAICGETRPYEPHPFRTRNDLIKSQRTRSYPNENAARSTKPISMLPLITVWLQVRVLPGPPAFAREARKAAAPKPAGRRRAVRASYGSASHPAFAREASYSRQSILLRALRFAGFAAPSVPGRNGNFNRCSDRAALTSNCPGHLLDQTSNDPTAEPGNRRDVLAFRKPLAVVSKDQVILASLHAARPNRAHQALCSGRA